MVFLRLAVKGIRGSDGRPKSGSTPPEFQNSRYRQISEPPCRVFYRYDGKTVFVLHVMRAERLLRKSNLEAAEKAPKA